MVRGGDGGGGGADEGARGAPAWEVRMPKRRLTKRQRAIIAHCRAGNTIRRRGAYGEGQAGPGDLRFAASITIDQLIREGWLVPADGWGEYRLNE